MFGIEARKEKSKTMEAEKDTAYLGRAKERP